jgi:GntR family transcriptional regulator/MocR family aminotransferase
VAVEWSGLGPDILVMLHRDSAVPLRTQLEDQIRQAIRSGRLSHGQRIPSSRVLARALGLSRMLVQECYATFPGEPANPP